MASNKRQVILYENTAAKDCAALERADVLRSQAAQASHGLHLYWHMEFKTVRSFFLGDAAYLQDIATASTDPDSQEPCHP